MIRSLPILLVLLVLVLPAAADELRVLPDQVDGVAPGDMMHAYLMRQVYAALDHRKAEYEKLQTPDDIAAYQKRTRRFFVDRLGGFPQRTPLEAEVTGRDDRDGYRIEKVLFQSQPGHYVTAILYLPDAQPPYPGVLVPCGHSANGKARDLYQRAPILMAKNGMAALCYDPIDQGERHQLLDADGKPVIASSTHGHNQTGFGAVLVGRNTATYRIWDGIRAIDYLQSREEIDPDRIGCTGISGGGTLTSYLMALDSRIQAAAPGCYLTSFRRLLETIGPQDAEQCIHAQLALGMDHADYVMVRAPRPTLIMTASDDYFDIEGAWDNFRQSKRLYARLGFAERVDLFETPGGHGFPVEMRVAATRWMRRWLLGVDDAITESEFPVAADEDLWCTPRGEVMLLSGARSVYDLNVELEEQLAQKRQAFWRETDAADALAAVRRVTGIRPLAELPDLQYEKIGVVQRDGYRIDKLLLRPEPGIVLPALAFVPREPDGEAYLQIHADGKQALAAPGGPLEKLALEGHLVLAVDLRGTGETASAGKHSYASYLPTEWRDATIAYLLGTSYLKMRAEDIVQSAGLLRTFETSAAPRRVHLVSTGRVGPAALHAAALEPDLFASVTLVGSLMSWSNVVHTPLARNQSVNLVHGALATYDLPDLIATLPEEKLRIVSPLDAAEEPAPSP